jgi:hypothetical protein
VVTFVEQTLVVLAILTAIFVVGGAVAFLVARKMWRRRWHGVRNHVATKGVLATATLVSSWRERAGARATPESLSLGTAARTRRRMWTAIEDAEAAVRHADATNAPVAELPAVCLSLRQVAGQLDALLQLERRLPTASRPDAVRTQVADTIAAARDVQAAALRACGDATQPQIRELVRNAGHEVEMVSAALSRLRSISPT